MSGIQTELREQGEPTRDPAVEDHRRRVSYFMVFRLGLVVAFSVLVFWTTDTAESVFRAGLAWAGVGISYVATIAFGLVLRRTLHLRRLVWVQVGFDVLLATGTVLLTGGLESTFVFAFIIAILGAATMGDMRLTLITFAACIGGYVAISSAQALDLLELVDEANVVVTVEPKDLPAPLLRNGLAMLVISTLAGLLNRQLLSTTSQRDSLRALKDNIVRSLSSGLLTIDQDARVMFANPTAYELLGLSAGLSGQLFGRECEHLLPGVRDHLDDSGGFRNRFELEIRRHDDGREIVVGLTSSALLDEQGRFLGHILHFQDVTELRRIEKILRRNERLTAIGSLAASVAHEIRNPLAAISGCAELLEGGVKGDENERLLRVIQRETTRLANIVNELLDYTRPRALARADVDLRRNLDELAESFRADRNHADVDLVVQLPSEPVLAAVDSTQLGQVLWNLVRNGVQAMDGKGQLELGLATTDDEVRLSVRDHGHGIEPEHLDRIFEPFFSTKAGGSGIGLALVHRIVEEHGGTIEVFSNVGVGTQFLIRLPR